MRGLVALVSVMGVLIVVGVAVVAVTILQRAGLGSAATASDLVLPDLILNEPPGTRIAGTASLGDRLAITLSGGGPDRIAIVDARHGRTLAHISLAR